MAVFLLSRRIGVARMSLALGAANAGAALSGLAGLESAGLFAAEFVILSSQMILCLLQGEALRWLLAAVGTSHLRRGSYSWLLGVQLVSPLIMLALIASKGWDQVAGMEPLLALASLSSLLVYVCWMNPSLCHLGEKAPRDWRPDARASESLADWIEAP